MTLESARDEFKEALTAYIKAEAIETVREYDPDSMGTYHEKMRLEEAIVNFTDELLKK